jgi:hypothetical protein
MLVPHPVGSPAWLGHTVVMARSIQNLHWFFPAVLDQGPGYLESFGWMGLRTRFFQAIFPSEEALHSSHNYSLILYKYHLIIGHYQTGRTVPRHGAPYWYSSSATQSIWHLRSTDASYAHRMSSPKMNLSVILATSTQIFSGRHHILSARETSFHMGRAPQDTVCSG